MNLINKEWSIKMIKLKTIQTNGKINDVYVVDELGVGNAHHTYTITNHGTDPNVSRLADITFQKGPRNDPEFVHCILDSDLLEIVRHRLACFQSGEFKSEYTEQALIHLNEALFWLNKRVEDRLERNVLGTNNK